MSVLSSETRSISGTGIGLRSQHIQEILQNRPDIPWFELLADNHLSEGGLDRVMLDKIAAEYPLTLHCVGMSVASVDPLDKKYCQKIKQLSEQVNASWISEHLCFSSAMEIHSHDLLPIPYNEKSLAHCVERIEQIQEALGQQILIENVSSYMKFKSTDMSEIDFIVALAEAADCNLLIDVNNIYVNQVNQGLDGAAYIDRLPLERIKEIHLAGFQEEKNFILDAHNNPVSEPVWKLYQRLIERKADIPALIEWDNDIPPFQTLVAEANRASHINETVKKRMNL